MNPRRIYEEITRYRVHRAANLPFVTDLRVDLNSICRNVAPLVFFAVGANVGQSIPRLRNCFPNSPVYCFEPVDKKFRNLTIAARNKTGIFLEQLGLSNLNQKVCINLNTDSTECSLEYSYGEGQTEEITLTTIDQYCHDHSIPNIQFLKIDIEGHELSTLEGASKLFASQAIDFLFLEAEIVPSDRHFISILDYAEFLKQYGLSLVSIYDQTHEWNGTRKLQFCNALFGRNDVLRK